mmetsp:Transcript_31718/g.63796  ORF Transcript_31718/g.63796 Transcript_31718/m.63796 type:complete len:477 (-) Transcript_31718:276-1706(-)|eukprot:CAMPEP_0196743050 /NCGR_PEP_ID=MMETSP1091-20130531/50418_1 /TAXON_ID=302021 /ORGANISM="Rhodomonas sp., Strain CCMP768" /LENGTH=476 /DNA_ID=CAMNT_0042089287 /DNA_START=62 /DNA_END=1492 /DNA_ORIENTATION=+
MLRSVLLSALLSSVAAFSLSPSLPGATFAGRFQAKTSVSPFGLRASRSNRPAIVMEVEGLKRVAVTGIGIISCLGLNKEEVTQSLKEAKSGIRFREEFAEKGLKSHVCGWPQLTEADFKARIPRQSLRFMANNAKYCYLALEDALKDAGMEPEDWQENPRIAAILGQGGTSAADIYQTCAAVESQAPRWANKVGPYRVTRTMGSCVSATLATAFKLQGPSFSISSACSTGSHCIGVGMEQIQLGKSDMAVCGAGEDDCWEFTSMFDCMGALSTKYNEEPTSASRAFDKTRDGFVIAGGSGVLVLEEMEHAKKRGAKIYAELVGYAANSDGFDMVAPSGVGGENCMKIAMEMANKRDERPVDYINTHGTSTPVGDAMELNAIKRTFDPLGYKPFVGSTKSLSGHSLSAAGVQEAIYSLLMVQDGFLAESAHITDLCDEAEGMKILTKREDTQAKRVLSNSFGFGGTNACLIFDKVDA